MHALLSDSLTAWSPLPHQPEPARRVDAAAAAPPSTRPSSATAAKRRQGLGCRALLVAVCLPAPPRSLGPARSSRHQLHGAVNERVTYDAYGGPHCFPPSDIKVWWGRRRRLSRRAAELFRHLVNRLGGVEQGSGQLLGRGHPHGGVDANDGATLTNLMTGGSQAATASSARQRREPGGGSRGTSSTRCQATAPAGTSTPPARAAGRRTAP